MRHMSDDVALAGVRVACFITTFNRPEALSATISTILSQTLAPELLLVVDNSDSAATASALSELNDHRVVHHRLGRNAGPAGSAAYALERLEKEGFDWILWGDDDDALLTNDTVERLVRLGLRMTDAGIVTAVGGRWNAVTGELVRLRNDELQGVVELDTFGGNTRAVIRAAAIRKVGVPNPELFFGYEEFEYSQRVKRGGFSILGDADLHRTYREISGRSELQAQSRWEKVKARRSPWRQYYSTRNYIYFMRRCAGRPDLARREILKALLRVFTSLTRGVGYSYRFSKLQLMAVRDGYRDRLGRTVSPESKSAITR